MSIWTWLFPPSEKERHQAERGQEVADSVHKTKNEFTGEMLKIHAQSRKLSKTTQKSLQQSIELKEMIDSVAFKMGVINGSIRVPEEGK